MTLGEKIDIMRRAADLSPAQFLKAVGIETKNPTNYYSMIKRDKRQLSPEKLQIAATACGCSIEFVPIHTLSL